MRMTHKYYLKCCYNLKLLSLVQLVYNILTSVFIIFNKVQFSGEKFFSLSGLIHLLM